VTPEKSRHNSKQALDDVLLGLSSLESDAQREVRAICRSRSEGLHTKVRMFTHALLVWSEALPTVGLLAAKETESRVRDIYTGKLGSGYRSSFRARYATFQPRSPFCPYGLASTSVRESSEAQIAQGNDLQRSVNAAPGANLESPICEFQRSSGLHARLIATPGLKDR